MQQAQGANQVGLYVAQKRAAAGRGLDDVELAHARQQRKGLPAGALDDAPAPQNLQPSQTSINPPGQPGGAQNGNGGGFNPGGNPPAPPNGSGNPALDEFQRLLAQRRQCKWCQGFWWGLGAGVGGLLLLLLGFKFVSWLTSSRS